MAELVHAIAVHAKLAIVSQWLEDQAISVTAPMVLTIQNVITQQLISQVRVTILGYLNEVLEY